MGQARLNWCMILHVHNDETDNLDLNAVAMNLYLESPAALLFLEILFKL